MSWPRKLVAPLALVLATGCGGSDGDSSDATTVATTELTVASSTRASSEPPGPPSTLASPPAPSIDVATTVGVQPVGVQPVGFERTAATVTLADGTPCQLCLWVADTIERRTRGLMGVTDLGGADGMVFVYEAPTESQFWMRNTPTPLSIGFFAADGAFVSSTEMVPCLGGADSDCARYAAAGPYTAAIEVPSGGLAALGIGPGSHLVLLPTDCDTPSP